MSRAYSPKLICFFFLFLVGPLPADAAQLGRATSPVNFRVGPGISAPIIEILPNGSELSVQSETTTDWYLVIYRGRRGFIHKHYVKLYHDQSSDGWLESKYRQLAKPIGIVIAGIGIILVASVLMPTLLKTATALVIALLAIVVFDLSFQLGILYSLFCVSFGVFVLLLFFRKTRDRSSSADQISPRKAA